MLKILLVEDEYIVRKGLRTTIDFESYGLNIVDEAVDGEEGYEKYLLHKPDIIITDVRMPCMNGIEMITKISEIPNHDCKFLILSGYNDFEYLQGAIKCSACDYLLKPIENRVLIDSLLKIKNEIEVAKQRKDKISQINLKLNFLRDSFIINLLNGEIPQNQLTEKMKFYDIMPPSNKFFIIYASSKRNLVDECSLNEKCYVLNCKLDESTYVFLIFMEGIDNNIAPIINDLMDERYCAVLGVSDVYNSLEDIPSAYKCAKQAYDHSDKMVNTVSFYLGEEQKNNDYIVEKAIKIVKEQYSAPLSVKSIAEFVNISESHFMFLFKKEMGVSFNDYLTNYRMEIAVKLIKLRKYKIYEICNMVGYKDLKHFRKVFKKYTGVSPVEFLNHRIAPCD